MPRSKRHYRITLGDALAAHDVALSFGGRDGLADLGLLESAIARPYDGYHRTIYSKAAALIQSVTVNHAFIDGNKRTAFILCLLLLGQSGYALHQTSTHSDNDLEHLILDLTTRFLTLEEVEDWLKTRITRD